MRWTPHMKAALGLICIYVISTYTSSCILACRFRATRQIV